MDDTRQKVLFSFNMLFDTDTGLMNLISESYRSDFFNLSVLDEDDYSIKTRLIRRKSTNPLSILTEDDDILALYSQFMDERYISILERSEFTDIVHIVNACVDCDEYDVFIQYENKYEYDFIKSIYGDSCKLVKREEVNCADIDILYVKSFDDLIRFKNCNYVNVYIARYGFNVELNEQGMESIDSGIMDVLFVTNRCNIVNVYKNISLYDLEEQDGKDD